MLYKFNFLFLLHNKIISNSSLSSSPTVQRTNNNSFTYVYKHFEFIFVVFATLVYTYIFRQNHYHRFTQITILWKVCILYKLCQLFWQFLPIMLVLCSELRWHNSLKPIFHTSNFNNSLCKHTVTYNGKFLNW